jgi:hypothetical protein
MDMVASVKECAERVLVVLARSQQVNLLSIVSLLGERSVIVYQAVGWLAHAGHITYVQERNQVYISLADQGR